MAARIDVGKSLRARISELSLDQVRFNQSAAALPAGSPFHAAPLTQTIEPSPIHPSNQNQSNYAEPRDLAATSRPLAQIIDLDDQNAYQCDSPSDLARDSTTDSELVIPRKLSANISDVDSVSDQGKFNLAPKITPRSTSPGFENTESSAASSFRNNRFLLADHQRSSASALRERTCDYELRDPWRRRPERGDLIPEHEKDEGTTSGRNPDQPPNELQPGSAMCQGAGAAAGPATTEPSEICLLCQDFSAVDAYASHFPRHAVGSLSTLAHKLTSHFPTRIKKARAIFSWIHHNIAYNTAAYFSGNLRAQTPEDTLRSGLAVCQGYAELFAELAIHSGLDCKVISGHGKGYSYKEPPVGSSVVPAFESNHAWNALLLESGEWHLIDPCWGAGGVESGGSAFMKRFSPQYFTSSPQNFRLQHFPTNAADQFCPNIITWQEYSFSTVNKPHVYGVFCEFGFNELDIKPRTELISPGTLYFEINSKCTHRPIPPSEQYVLVLAIGGTETVFEVDATNRKWSCVATVEPRHRGANVEAYVVNKIGGESARGLGVNGFFKRKAMGTSWSLQGLCRWKVQ